MREPADTTGDAGVFGGGLKTESACSKCGRIYLTKRAMSDENILFDRVGDATLAYMAAEV